jgi:hypothetical protein
MSRDRCRLHLKGITWRIPNPYHLQLTIQSHQVASLFSKLDARIFGHVVAAMDASQLAPPPLAAALDQAAQAIAGLVNHAHPDSSPI